MAPTPVHDGPAQGISSFYTDLVGRKLSISPPFSLATVLNLKFFHDLQANVGTYEGADKYPDLVSGFQVDGIKYLWDVLETAKSQGLYTHLGSETLNKEGVLNKVSSSLPFGTVRLNGSRLSRSLSTHSKQPRRLRRARLSWRLTASE